MVGSEAPSHVSPSHVSPTKSIAQRAASKKSEAMYDFALSTDTPRASIERKNKKVYHRIVHAFEVPSSPSPWKTTFKNCKSP